MSSDSNPYQSPQAEIDSVKSLAVQGVMTDRMVCYLKDASPWIRFIGIVGYILSGMTILSGLVTIIAVPMMENIGTSFIRISAFTHGIGGFAGLIYIIMGAFCFFPARFTYIFGTRIRNFIKNNSEKELELAFKYNKSLWKFTGIMTIIGLAFIPVVMVITIILMVVNLI